MGLGLVFALLGAFSSLAPLRGGVLAWQVFVVAIDVWILVYLNKPHVKQAFGATSI